MQIEQVEVWLCYPLSMGRPLQRVDSDIVPCLGDRIIAPDYADYKVTQVVHDFSSKPYQMRVYVEEFPRAA